MIDRLRLKNFQAHKALDVEFGGITTFVGKSDAGKSAVLRALKWIFLNKPAGGEFITDGKDSCAVTVWKENEKLRKTRKKTNVYQLGEEVYKAFGTKVPDPVQEFLPLSPINFQFQHDAPFWFNLSPGQVQKEINEYTNLEEFDKVLKVINSRRNSAKSSLKAVNKETQELEKEIQEREEWLVPALQCLKKIKDSQEKLHEEESDLTCAEDILAEAQSTRDKLADITILIEAAVPLLNSKELQSISRAEKELKEIQCLVDKQRSLQSQLRKTERLLQKLKDQVSAYKQCPLCNQPMTL